MTIEQRALATIRTSVVRERVREPGPDSDRASAFQALAEQHLFASYKLATAILGDPDESQDAVHDAVVTAWQRWDSLRDRSSFEAWFQRIVVNTCRDRLRRSTRRRTSDIAAATTLATADASGSVENRVLVAEALATLEPDDQVVLALRHYLDLEIKDIALLLDVPTSTANSRLRAARDRLRAVLAPAMSDGGPR